MLEQFRLLLAAAAHVGKSELRVAAHRHDILRTDEDRDLTVQAVGARLEQVRDNKERRSVLVELGALVALLCVFDRQLVEIEFLLKRHQLRWLRVLQGDPDEAVASLEVRAHLCERDVGVLLPAIVSHTVDNHSARFRFFALYMF
jgi:hypothetical protein